LHCHLVPEAITHAAIAKRIIYEGRAVIVRKGYEQAQKERDKDRYEETNSALQAGSPAWVG
jgi:hypothetical protein